MARPKSDVPAAASQEPTIGERFYSLFKANPDVYVRHEPPFAADASGKIKGAWVGIAKEKIYEGKKYTLGDILPLTAAKYKEHLTGGDGLAVEPLRPDNKCFFAAIEIDVYGINYTSLIQKLYHHGLKFAPFVSKSGGLHAYFFFKDPEKGKDVLAFLSKVVEVFGLNRLYTSDKGKSKIELFPKHAVLEPGSNGSHIFLPYYNAENPEVCRQKMISSEGKLLGIVKALAAVEGMITSLDEMNDVMKRLPYSDAPFCVQMITLTGALAEGDGRNDYIYQCGVYLKKKQKENFLPELLAMNAELAEPQPEKDVAATYASVMSKQLEYKCKTGVCSEFCDTKLCRLREYGVGKDKANHFTGFASWGEISRVMAAQPYYLWKVQVEEGGSVKEIRIDCEADIMNELVVARACIQYVNRAPLIVKANDWIGIVNQSLSGIESRQIEVPKNTDTSEMSALQRYFMRYLTHRQVQHDMAILVQAGQVYHKEGFYYFTTDGFKDYLRIQKFPVARLNLRAELLRYGCEDGKVQYTVRSGVKEIACWKKAEDDELLGMGVYYDDLHDSDGAAVAENKLQKVDESFDQEQGVTKGDDDGKYQF